MLLDDLDAPIETALGTLRVRALTPADAPAFAEHVRADLPRLGEHLNWPDRARELAGARMLLEGYAADGGRHVTIAGAWEGATLVAGSLLVRHDPRMDSVEMGVWATARGAGTGAAAGACRAVAGAARTQLGVERIAWRAATDNPRSRRLAERLGFRFEGVMRSDFVLRGVRKDTWLLSLVGAEIDHCATDG